MLEQQIAAADMQVIIMIRGVTGWERKRNEDLYISYMLLIVQVINQKTLRWFGHVVRRDDE